MLFELKESARFRSFWREIACCLPRLAKTEKLFFSTPCYYGLLNLSPNKLCLPILQTPRVVSHGTMSIFLEKRDPHLQDPSLPRACIRVVESPHLCRTIPSFNFFSTYVEKKEIVEARASRVTRHFYCVAQLLQRRRFFIRTFLELSQRKRRRCPDYLSIRQSYLDVALSICYLAIRVKGKQAASSASSKLCAPSSPPLLGSFLLLSPRLEMESLFSLFLPSIYEGNLGLRRWKRVHSSSIVVSLKKAPRFLLLLLYATIVYEMSIATEERESPN